MNERNRGYAPTPGSLSDFTPGPWKRTQGRPFDIYQDKGPRQGGRYIGTTRGNSTHLPISVLLEDEANARLIAAAPELLEACEQLIRWNDKGSKSSCEAIRLAKAAIEKATGPDRERMRGGR